MTLLYCKILYTVAEQGSFNKAAGLLNLTPSAVSHAVTAMERELGFQVFNRNKGGVTLTGFGEEIYPYVVDMLNSEESLQQLVDRLNGLEQGTVKIGAFNSVCIQWLPTILKKFRKKFPGIEVEVYEGSYDDVIYWLNTGIVEIGFLSTSCNTDFPMIPLHSDPLVCIAPKGFQTREKGYISLEEMQHHPFIIQRESVDVDIKKFLNETKLNIRSSAHVMDDQAMAAMVASGFGISIMPELTSRSLQENLEILKIRQDKESVRMIGLAGVAKKNLSPAATQMRKLILDICRDESLEGVVL